MRPITISKNGELRISRKQTANIISFRRTRFIFNALQAVAYFCAAFFGKARQHGVLKNGDWRMKNGALI